jgi:hypothetical protein
MKFFFYLGENIYNNLGYNGEEWKYNNSMVNADKRGYICYILSYIEKVLIYSHFLVEDTELHITLFSSFLFHEKSI